MTKGYKPEKNGFDVWIWNKLILYTFCFDKDVRHFSNDSLEHGSSIKLARIFRPIILIMDLWTGWTQMKKCHLFTFDPDTLKMKVIVGIIYNCHFSVDSGQ